MTIIKFRRGNKANMPASAPSGMPLWCEDTKELYLGTGDSVHLINSGDDFVSAMGNLKPYSANYGNYDVNGYADLIEKISDNEVSFKVGGVYPNLGITFPNGNHYEISEMPNITGLNIDTLYTFVIIEENLTQLEDETYRAVAIAVQIGYEQVERIPALTSASHDGYTAEYLGTLGFDPYNIFDDDENTNVYAYDSGWPPQTYYPAGSLDSSEGINRCSSFVLTFDEIKNIEYLVVKSNPYGSGGHLNYLTSTDGGVTWSEPSENITLSNTTAIDINQNVNAIKFRFYHGYSVVGDTAFPGVKWYTRWQISVTDIDIYERIAYPGGAITEDMALPASPVAGDMALLINQTPILSKIFNGTEWIEKQFVKIGQVQKLSGLLGTPISYAFNGYYYHEEPLWGNNQSKIKNHNIGTNILKHDIKLKCISNNQGFKPGDIVYGMPHRQYYHAQKIGDLDKNTIHLYITSAAGNGWNINKKGTNSWESPSFSCWNLVWIVERGF